MSDMYRDYCEICHSERRWARLKGPVFVCSGCGSTTSEESLKEAGVAVSETDQEELDEYEQGILDTLEALLRQTAHTTTQTEVLMAAFDSNRIPSEMVHRAREQTCDVGGYSD